MEYPYPVQLDWSKQEVIDVINFFQLIERAHEKGVERNLLLAAYSRFKEIVPSKSEEKQLCNQFEKDSGLSTYHTIKHARQSNDQKVKIQK